MEPMCEINDLADFFKYCLNCGCWTRDVHDKNMPFHGWMRCRITPYLINGKVKDPNFIDALVYTITDYFEYCSCFESMGSPELKIKTERLLNYIKLHKNDLVPIIEENAELFPTDNDLKHTNIIEEHWNDKAYEKRNGEDEENEYDENQCYSCGDELYVGCDKDNYIDGKGYCFDCYSDICNEEEKQYAEFQLSQQEKLDRENKLTKIINEFDSMNNAISLLVQENSLLVQENNNLKKRIENLENK
jgi:regulator of replication initiation timing